jgi:hypothetical protein
MRNEAGVAKNRGPEAVTTAGVPKGELPMRQPGGGYTEPILVEFAWLVIEGAVFLRRLRGLLARI